MSAVMLLIMWLVVPFAQHWRARDMAAPAAARDRWERVATLVANTGRLRQALDSARRVSGADQGQIVVGATPALAASAIQDVLQRDATQSSVQVERVDAAGEPHSDKPVASSRSPSRCKRGAISTDLPAFWRGSNTATRCSSPTS